MIWIIKTFSSEWIMFSIVMNTHILNCKNDRYLWILFKTYHLPVLFTKSLMFKNINCLKNCLVIIQVRFLLFGATLKLNFGYSVELRRLWHYVGGPLSRQSLCLFWRDTKQRAWTRDLRRDRKWRRKAVSKGTQREWVGEGRRRGEVDNGQQ